MHLFVPVVAALAAFAALVTACAAPAAVPPELAGLRQVTVPAGDRDLRLVVAEDVRRGLSGIMDLGPLDGMLFDYGREVDPADHRFWMAGMRFPLELAFVAGDGRIVDRVTLEPCRDTAPCPSHEAAEPFRWVVETRPGTLGPATRLDLEDPIGILTDAGAYVVCPVANPLTRQEPPA